MYVYVGVRAFILFSCGIGVYVCGVVSFFASGVRACMYVCVCACVFVCMLVCFFLLVCLLS